MLCPRIGQVFPFHSGQCPIEAKGSEVYGQQVLCARSLVPAHRYLVPCPCLPAWTDTSYLVSEPRTWSCPRTWTVVPCKWPVSSCSLLLRSSSSSLILLSLLLIFLLFRCLLRSTQELGKERGGGGGGGWRWDGVGEGRMREQRGHRTSELFACVNRHFRSTLEAATILCFSFVTSATCTSHYRAPWFVSLWVQKCVTQYGVIVVPI